MNRFLLSISSTNLSTILGHVTNQIFFGSLETMMHEDPVLAYMQSRNRPYSVQNVFDNLRGEIAKAKVSLSLEVR